MGSGLRSYWPSDLASSAKKIKVDVRYIYPLTISHLSLARALSRMCRETVSFSSLSSHTCGVSGPEPTSLHSIRARIQDLCCSV